MSAASDSHSSNIWFGHGQQLQLLPPRLPEQLICTTPSSLPFMVVVDKPLVPAVGSACLSSSWVLLTSITLEQVEDEEERSAMCCACNLSTWGQKLEDWELKIIFNYIVNSKPRKEIPASQ